MENNYPLIMTEEVWRNSQLSVARFYGGIKINGKEYEIVNKHGQTLFETAIAPGEPADLIVVELVKTYRALGRDKVMELVRQGKNVKEILEVVKATKIRNKKNQIKLDL